MTKTRIGFMGVDPGKSGACALLVCDHPKYNTKPILWTFDWPKSDNIVTVISCLDEWMLQVEIKNAILEKVSSMPKQGVKSMFTFGKNFGIWQALLACYDIPHTLLTPVQWRKIIPITKSDGPNPKAQVETVVCRKYPEFKNQFYGPKGGFKDGRAEATLLASVAMRKELPIKSGK